MSYRTSKVSYQKLKLSSKNHNSQESGSSILYSFLFWISREMFHTTIIIKVSSCKLAVKIREIAYTVLSMYMYTRSIVSKQAIWWEVIQ